MHMMHSMQTATKEAYAALQALMHRAFKLVEPATHWKAPIDAVVTWEALVEADVTIDRVAEAVSYFTGTPATVAHDPAGYHVTAPGYWAGPCN